jgi:DHA1 family inner membrane transport protein
MFAAQSGLIALSPVLAEVADEFGVSTAAAGQLRTVAGLAAGVTALVLSVAARRLGLRRLLVGGALLLAAGSLVSAAAPSFAVLALAQLRVGVAVAVLVAPATAAAAEWAPPAARTRVLSWALVGSPAAWIVGMPTIGFLGDESWRYAWLALPLTGALAAAVAVARRPRSGATAAAAGGARSVLSADPALRRWLLGELAATSAWLGLLVYAGALFAESYGTSPAATGAVLALVAAVFVAGNLGFRRAADADARRPLVRLALAMAPLVALLGLVRPSPVFSAAVLAAISFLGGGRTLLGSAYGFHAEPEQRRAAMAARAAANQFGSFVGASTAGLALTAWGYGGFGLALGALFVVAAVLVGDLGPAVRLTPPRRRRATSPARLQHIAVPDRAR